MKPRIKRVEFIITWACTGRCKHCSLSLGEADDTREHIEYAKLAGMLTRIKTKHPVESVMCFGGEPLLYPDKACAIFEEAQQAGIPRRQLITNGCFSRDPEKIAAVADKLNACATEILLSVDAFHQETIPLEPVKAFADRAERVKLHPSWLVSPEDDNPWNLRTREVLAQFPGVPVSKGNVVFPRGNALKFLREYFPKALPRRSPYDQVPRKRVKCIAVCPNGDVLQAHGTIGSAYTDDILEIVKRLR